MANTAEMTQTPFTFRWSAVFAAAFVTLGMWILLYAFGLAVGLSTIDPSNPDSAKSAGIGTGVWTLIAPLIALFIGGLVVARVGGILDKAGGVIHGAVLWALTTVAGILMIGAVLSTLMAGILGVGKAAASGVASAASGAASASQGGGASKIADAAGIDADTLLAPVNQKLQQQGKPAVTSDQLGDAAQQAIRSAVTTGKVDRETLVQSLSQNTSLSRSDAEDLATRLQSQIDAKKDQVGQKVGQVKQQATQGALSAASATGKAFWGIFAALALGLISSILGATAGTTKRQQRLAQRATAPATPVRVGG